MRGGESCGTGRAGEEGAGWLADMSETQAEADHAAAPADGRATKAQRMSPVPLPFSMLGLRGQEVKAETSKVEKELWPWGIDAPFEPRI